MKYKSAGSVLAAAIAACLTQPGSAAPTTLSDAALDGVTAGTLPATPVPDGVRPSAIVADGASYTLALRESVELSGEAQTGARALNSTNASGSDVVSALNVAALDTQGSAIARQHNMLTQRELEIGSLGQASLSGPHRVESSSVSRSLSNTSSSTLVTGFRQQSRSRSTTIDQFSVFVPAFTPLQDLSLTIGTPELDPITIPSFGIDFVEAGSGIRGSVGPFTLGPPQLVLGTFSLDGDDIVLSSGFVQLPSIDLGSAELEVCVAGACGGDSVDLGSFSGPRIDFPAEHLRLEGANPFKDTRINAGHGIAAVGEGSVSVTPGHLALVGSFEIDPPDLTFSLDFEIPIFDDFVDPFVVDGPDIVIEIPPVAFEHALIDEDVGVSFTGTFDGMLCLALGTTDCGTGSRSVEREQSHIDQQIVISMASASASGAELTSETREVHAGATLTAAAAELIVMSQSSAAVESASEVVLGERAQREMRALNTVNAVSAMVGNTANVTSMATGAATSLAQSNAFVQYQTRYGL